MFILMPPNQLNNKRRAARRLSHLRAPLGMLRAGDKRPSPAIGRALSPALGPTGKQGPNDDNDGAIPYGERALRFAYVVEQGCR